MTMVAGTKFILFTILWAGIVIVTTVQLSRSGRRIPKIRRIAGLDSIEEAIGRATEMGRPVHYTPGLADVTAETAPQTFAALEILGYVTGLTAKYNTGLIVTIRIPNVFPLAEEIVRQAYLQAGKPDMFKEDTVRFLSSQQFAYAAGVMGIFHREKVASNIMMGAFWAESLLFAEAGAQIGAIQIAGTASTAQVPFFVAACDYTLIGEELYAGGAYLSQDPARLGSIAGQDYMKLVAMVLVALGTMMQTFGSGWLNDLTRK